MSKPLPKNDLLTGGWEPWAAECDIYDLVVRGKIPIELNGTYFRNGANPQYVFSENYHIWDGDGMLHAISFYNGEAHYRNRWIRTERFSLERQARRGLFAGMRDYGKSDPSVRDKSPNTANTSIIWHADKLLALQEGSLPLSICENDLSTIGNWTFDAQLNRSMMAHPCIDPKTGELLFYSYVNPPIEDHIYYYVANSAGKIQRCKKISVPFLSIMHDFAITRDYVIFPVFPFTLSFKRVMQGGSPTAWEPKLNTHFGIMPRNGSSKDVIWLQDDPCMVFHFFNAYQEKDCIILDAMAINTIPDNADHFKQGENQVETYPFELTRWIFEPNIKKISKQILDATSGEFPRIDDRFVGTKYSHGYVASTVRDHTPKNLFDAITHHDFVQNKKQIHQLDSGDFTGEPLFIPRNKAAKEGDGFLLAYAYHEKENRSDLIILDAQHVDDEPLAVIQLPHRVPYGFHGCWVEHT